MPVQTVPGLEEKRKEEKIHPLRALSEEDKSTFFGKKVPRKSLFPRKVFGPKRHRWTPKNQFESQISPFPESKGERSKPAFSRKNRSKRKERPLPHSASLTDQLFFCARARGFSRRILREARSRREREREKIFKRRVPKEFEGKRKTNAYLLCLGSSLSRYRWCPKTPPLR